MFYFTFGFLIRSRYVVVACGYFGHWLSLIFVPNLNFIDVRFRVIEFTIGVHRGASGEVCQLSTMVTKGNTLEIESSMVQRKCIKALKGKAVMSGNLAQSKKIKC